MARSNRPSRISTLHQHTRKSTLACAIRAVLLQCAPTIAGALISSSVMANPEGGQVVHGAATLQAPNATTLNILQSSERAVIDWRAFSIGADEQVNFHQPSSTAATLNRVTGGQRSVINGALNANGNIFLLNSSGVLFGSQSRVDVGGLLATTSQISNDDFMNARLSFSAGAAHGASIENFGQITVSDGGMAALVAPSVRNAGIIRAQLGRIALGAGETFTVDLFGDRLINFALPGSSLGAEGYSVDQTGSLIADGGSILLSADAASNIVGGVVNMSGIAQARSASVDALGRIVLEAAGGTATLSGTLDTSGAANGSSGGDVRVYADHVSLTSTAIIDASGDTGGGTVHVGGGFLGEDTPRARTATVAAGASIDASARASGNGGNVAVWGTEQAQFEGAIAARGGSASGDGGFVEVSTHELLQFLGEVFVDAPRGQAGTLLLDPADVRIEAIGSPGAIGDISVIAASRLESMLRSGTNVVLTASNSITVNQLVDGRPLAGNATSGAINLSAGSLVIAQPVITNNNSISLNATSGSITFRGDGYLYVASVGAGSAPQVGNSPISLTATQNVTTDAGSGANAGQLITLGPVSITATSGNVQFRQALAGLANSNGIGALTVRAGNNIELRGVKSTGAIDIRSTGASGRIANESAPLLTSAGGIRLESGSGGIALGPQTAAAAPQVGAQANAGDVLLITNGPVTLNESVVASTGNVCLGAGTDDACIATAANANTRLGSLTMAAGTAVQAGGTTANTGISIYGSGAVQAQDLLTGSAGRVLIDTADSSATTAGAVTLNRALSGFGNATAGTGIGSLRIDADGAVSLAGVKTLQTVSVAGGSIDTGSAAIDAGGNVTLASGGPNGLSVGAAGTATAIDSRGAVTLSSASTGAIAINGTVLTNGGNIAVNSGGAVTVAQAANLQTVRNAASSGTLPSGTSANTTAGAISITSGGASTLNGGLMAGTQGAVTVNAGGDATLGAGLFGLDGTTSSVGSLSVTATGVTTTNGALTNGDIAITGAQVLNQGSSLVASSGNVTLTSTGNGGISLLGRSADGVAIGSQLGTVTLRTNSPAALNIEGGIKAAGAVQIGSDTNAIASLRLTSDSVIDAASVTIRAATSAGSSAALIDSQRRTTPAASAVTPGAVWLGTVNVANGGRVDIRGADITLLGSVGSGQTGVANSTTNPVRPGPAGEVAIFGARSVDTRSINGGRSAAGVAQNFQLLTDNGGRISIRGQLESYGDMTIGLAAAPSGGTSSRINLSHNIFTYGRNVDFNGDVILFDGIDRWAAERASLGVGNTSSDPYVDGSLLVVPGSLAVFGVSDMLMAVDANGQVLTDFNDSTCGAWRCASSQAWTRLFAQLTATVDTSRDPTATPVASGNLNFRGNVQRYVPQTFATLPTPRVISYNTDGLYNSVANGNVRTITPQDPPGSTLGNGTDHDTNAVLYVGAGFVHHMLHVEANAVAVAGKIGDDANAAARTGVNAGPYHFLTSVGTPVTRLSPDGAITFNISSGNTTAFVDRNAPDLGTFMIDLSAATPPAASATTGTFVYDFVRAATNDDFNDDGTIDYSWATGTVLLADYQIDSDDPGDIGRDPGAPSELRAGGGGQITLTGGGAARAGGNAGAAGAGGTARNGTAANGAIAAATSSAAAGILSTASSDDKRDSETEQDSAAASQAEDTAENAHCARGASAEADLGQMSGVEGAAPDVSARCEELGG